MRNVRNITVSVTPELYRQTRKLAAEYDSTVSAMVAYLLERFPDALKRARYPVGGPKPAFGHPTQLASSKQETSATPPHSPHENKIACPGCETGCQTLNHSLSNTCESNVHTGTAPVPQYQAANQHIPNGL